MKDEKYEKLSPGIKSISQPTPQIAQLQIQFAGPLTDSERVEKVEDLILLNPKYLYQQKMVWVKERKAFYFIDNGDGTDLDNWKKQIARLVVDKWIETEEYQKGDCVYWNRKLYKALQDVPRGYNPSDFEMYWECICGETETYRYLFINASSVLVYTEIRNPIFETIVGTFILDENGYPTVDPETQMIIVENQEIVHGFVKKREDLPFNDGFPYEIFFEENMLPVKMNGVINIK